MKTYIVSNSGTHHLPAEIDWIRDRAVSRCQRVEGEPIKADPDPSDVCELCQPDPSEGEDAD